MQKVSNTVHNHRVLTIGSTTLTLREWAKRGKLSYYTLKWRVNQGWPPERLFERRNAVKDGMKVCSKCQDTKPVEGFYERSRGGWLAECKVCFKARYKR